MSQILQLATPARNIFRLEKILIERLYHEI